MSKFFKVYLWHDHLGFNSALASPHLKVISVLRESVVVVTLRCHVCGNSISRTPIPGKHGDACEINHNPKSTLLVETINIEETNGEYFFEDFSKLTETFNKYFFNGGTFEKNLNSIETSDKLLQIFLNKIEFLSKHFDSFMDASEVNKHFSEIFEDEDIDYILDKQSFLDDFWSKPIDLSGK